MKKTALFFSLLLVFVMTADAQSRKITKDKYDKAFDFAVRGTITAFPFIFTVKIETIENNKIVSTLIEVNEKEAGFRMRKTLTTVSDGKMSQKFQVKIDLEHNYCSDDGKSWKPSKYECYGPTMLYTPRDPESAEYGVTDGTTDGQPVKIYREYLTFSPSEKSEKKEFRERLSTIDSHGFFISVARTEGTLDPEIVTLKRTETWDFQTKFKPVVAPVASKP